MNIQKYQDIIDKKKCPFCNNELQYDINELQYDIRNSLFYDGHMQLYIPISGSSTTITIIFYSLNYRVQQFMNGIYFIDIRKNNRYIEEYCGHDYFDIPSSIEEMDKFISSMLIFS